MSKTRAAKVGVLTQRTTRRQVAGVNSGDLTRGDASTDTLQMGATVMSGLVGNVTIPKLPKQTATATAYCLTEETTVITESQHTFGQLALTPGHGRSGEGRCYRG